MSNEMIGGSAVEIEAFDLISKMADEVPRVSEQEFVSKYLPLFASQHAGVDMSPWLDVCKSAMLPVDVIAGGVVIFRVPALVRTIPTSRNPIGQLPLNEVLAIAKLKSDVYPPAGDAYLDQQTANRIGKATTNMDELVAWNNIFKRYNLPQIEIPGLTTEGGSKETPPSDVFTGDYEEA